MVEILVVLALALAAGAAVYRLSLYLTGEREAAPPSGSAGFLPEEQLLSAAAGDLPPGYRYAVLGPGRRSWQTRVVGFLGIVVLVGLGAMVLALSVYEVSHLIRLTLDGYVNAPSPTPAPRVGA